MEQNPDHTQPIYVSNGFGGSVDNIWMMFCCGAAGFRYHRQLWEPSGRCYRIVKAFSRFLEETELPYWTMKPAHEKLRGYGAYMEGNSDGLLYLPADNLVHYYPDATVKKISLRFYDPLEGTWLESDEIICKSLSGQVVPISFKSPSSTGTIVYMKLQR